MSRGKPKTGVVRSIKIEVVRDSVARHEEWLAISDAIQEATNCLWRHWLAYHTLNETAKKLRVELDALSQWHKSDSKSRGPKPEWTQCPFPETDWMFSSVKQARLPRRKDASSPRTGDEVAKQSAPDLQNDLYHIICKNYPSLHTNTVVLLLNKWAQTVKTRKSASGGIPGWASIILCREAVPSFTHPLPIPFDRKSSPGKTPLRKEGGEYRLAISIERNGSPVRDEVVLVLGKRKTAGVRAIVNKIMCGEWNFKGSSLQRIDGKWFVNIAYDRPIEQKPELRDDRILVVRPGRKSPWRVTILDGGKWGGSWRFGGNGKHVWHARRTIQSQRTSRREHYRWAGSAQKGRGGRRAESVWTKLSSRWKDFTKRYNHEVTKRIVNMAISRGCGRIIYLQPKDSKRDAFYLSHAGNDGRSQMSWDYFQFGTMLSSKCEVNGIEYIKKECAKKHPKDTAEDLRGLRKPNVAGNQRRAGRKASNLQTV